MCVMCVQALATADLKAGQRVLVHAGAGGVGHFAVQLARVHWGAHVTATAGPANQSFLKVWIPHSPWASPDCHLYLCPTQPHRQGHTP